MGSLNSPLIALTYQLNSKRWTHASISVHRKSSSFPLSLLLLLLHQIHTNLFLPHLNCFALLSSNGNIKVFHFTVTHIKFCIPKIFGQFSLGFLLLLMFVSLFNFLVATSKCESEPLSPKQMNIIMFTSVHLMAVIKP